jgi:drug/metabolite transporter (DMT)-like permease
VISAGWFFLAAMIGMYGVANLLQSIAAAKTTAHETLDPKLLVRLARHKAYLPGLGCQVLGFILAFLARRDLPLFLVQASVAAGLGVTALLGVAILRWRLPRMEIALLVLLCAGLAGLVLSAQPHASRQVGVAAVIGLLVVLVGLAVAGFFAARFSGVIGSVALGSLAGIAFGAAAVASRPLANEHSFDRFIGDPLLYLLIAHSLVGQLLLGLAMQRGSTTAAVAAMDAAAAVPAAVIGLLFLGDEITPGREWLAGLGFSVTLVAVIGLTFFAEPQHHHQVAGRHRVPDPQTPGLHTRGGRRRSCPTAATPVTVVAPPSGQYAVPRVSPDARVSSDAMPGRPAPRSVPR